MKILKRVISLSLLIMITFISTVSVQANEITQESFSYTFTTEDYKRLSNDKKL